MDNSEFEQYKTGVEAALKDYALMQNNCNENGYTEGEYIRISETVKHADWLLRIGSADAETKGYSDAFESAAIKTYAERGENNKIEAAVFTTLFQKYNAELPQIQFEGMERIKRFVQ